MTAHHQIWVLRLSPVIVVFERLGIRVEIRWVQLGLHSGALRFFHHMDGCRVWHLFRRWVTLKSNASFLRKVRPRFEVLWKLRIGRRPHRAIVLRIVPMLSLQCAPVKLALCGIDEILATHAPAVVFIGLDLRHRIRLLQSFTDLADSIRVFAHFIYYTRANKWILIWLWCSLFERRMHQLN